MKTSSLAQADTFRISDLRTAADFEALRARIDLAEQFISKREENFKRLLAWVAEQGLELGDFMVVKEADALASANDRISERAPVVSDSRSVSAPVPKPAFAPAVAAQQAPKKAKRANNNEYTPDKLPVYSYKDVQEGDGIVTMYYCRTEGSPNWMKAFGLVDEKGKVDRTKLHRMTDQEIQAWIEDFFVHNPEWKSEKSKS